MTETARRLPPQRQSRRRPAESFSQRSSPPKRHATYCRAGTAASRPRASCGRAGGRRLDGPHCARTEVAFDAWATARFRTFRSGGSSASTLRVITGNAGVPRARLPNAQPLADVPIFDRSGLMSTQDQRLSAELHGATDQDSNPVMPSPVYPNFCAPFEHVRLGGSGGQKHLTAAA
jgi:hypothetical protein